ncbi:MAG: CpaF family protein [Anaerolineae bacterium]|nr:CpaF family protein [Anaerolineae bacterium]
MTESQPQNSGSAGGSADIGRLRSYLLTQIHRHLEGNPVPDDQRRDAITQILEYSFTQTKVSLPRDTKAQLFREILDDLLGFGPIQALLDDPDVSEVMVNGPRRIYVERRGNLERTGVTFEDDAHVRRVIDKIVLPLGRRIDSENPTVDARLPDGSRVNAVVPPVAIDGSTITIRKFAKERLGVPDLIKYDSLTETMATFLEACVKAHLNIIISGGTGSGKTTLLNIMSGFIPEEERIVTIEDAAELQLQQDHVVRLETKAPNIDGHGGVSIRELVRNSLRMRPDRIVVGECRGGEALDMLQAMNTGHDGSLTTLHANTPRDATARLETLVLMSGVEMPLKVVREQIASAVDLIVQQTRLTDGSRKVTQITEVAGMEGDTIVMTDVFKYTQTGKTPEGKVLGELAPTGIRPLFMDKLQASGFTLSAAVFMKGSTAPRMKGDGSGQSRR